MTALVPKGIMPANFIGWYVLPKDLHMHKGLREPHVLLASGNPQRLIKNLAHILTATEIQKIHSAVLAEASALFALGDSHFSFAMSLPTAEWRQNISRLYYAAYNFKRAVTLMNDGGFSTESGDHQKIDILPDSIENKEIYKARLKHLRDDRNLCDYSHLATEQDLLITVTDARALVTNFMSDTKKFLLDKGVHL